MNEFHDDPRAPEFLGHVMHRGHRRVAEPGRGTGLAQRPLAQAVPLGLAQACGEPDFLDGDVAAKKFVPGAPHRAHGAMADRCGQPVAAADQQAGSRLAIGGPVAGRPFIKQPPHRRQAGLGHRKPLLLALVLRPVSHRSGYLKLRLFQNWRCAAAT